MTEELLARISLLEKENQRLKEEYIMLQNASEEYEDNLLKENQRLNKVLNELELWLKDIIDNNNDRFELYKEDILHNEYQINNIKYQNNILMAILEKLKELKESDK